MTCSQPIRLWCKIAPASDNFHELIMIDIEKQVAYWRDGALSDWEAAQVLLRRKLVWQGLAG